MQKTKKKSFIEILFLLMEKAMVRLNRWVWWRKYAFASDTCSLTCEQTSLCRKWARGLPYCVMTALFLSIAGIAW